jgi:hypothetical protein
MERQPYYQPAESGNKDNGSKDKKTSGGFNVAPGPAFQPIEQAHPRPPVERQPIPIAPAFEGVISWREKADEMLHESEIRRQTDQVQERIEPDAGKESVKDKEGKDSSKKQVQIPQPAEPIPAPRPLAEIMPTDKQQTEAESTAADDQDAYFVQPAEAPRSESPDTKEESGDAVQMPQPFDAFPPLEGRPAEAVEPAQDQPAQPLAQPHYAFRPPEGQVVAAPHVYEGMQEESSGTETYADTTEQPMPYASPGQQPAAYNQPPQSTANAYTAPFGPLPGNPAAPNFAPGSPNMPPAGGGNVPPAQPGYGFNNDPFGPYGPAYTPQPESAPVSHNAAPSMPIERPAMPTSNRDPRVGGVAALLGLEYFARKRADRKLEKRVNKRHDERLKQHEEQMAADQRRMQEQQRQFAAEQERQGREMHRMQYREVAPQSVSDALRSTANLPQSFEAAPNASTRAEQTSGPGVANRPFSPEAQSIRPSHEQHLVVPTSQEMRQQRPQPNAEQLAEVSDDQDIKLQPHQHLEHSAWHNIVVDDRGHEVAGAIQYGEGFRRERQQEAIRDRIADSGQPGATSQGAGGGFAQDQYGTPMLPSGMTTPSLPQGRGTHVDPQHQLPAHNKQQSNITNPWFWIMLLLIIAAFFTAALI